MGREGRLQRVDERQQRPGRIIQHGHLILGTSKQPPADDDVEQQNSCDRPIAEHPEAPSRRICTQPQHVGEYEEQWCYHRLLFREQGGGESGNSQNVPCGSTAQKAIRRTEDQDTRQESFPAGDGVHRGGRHRVQCENCRGQHSRHRPYCEGRQPQQGIGEQRSRPHEHSIEQVKRSRAIPMEPLLNQVRCQRNGAVIGQHLSTEVSLPKDRCYLRDRAGRSLVEYHVVIVVDKAIAHRWCV